MAEETAEVAETAPEGEQRSSAGQGEGWEESGGKGGKAAVLAELADARKRARALEKEVAKLQTASMSEQEKAVATAKQEAAVAAARATAPRLVRAELRAAAAEVGLAREALAGFLEYADLNRFVTEDGEVDDKAVTAAIRRLGGSGSTDFEGGPRGGSAKPTDMSSLIRRQAGVS